MAVCRYANKGMLIIDSSQKLKVLKTERSARPLRLKKAKASDDALRVNFWLGK